MQKHLGPSQDYYVDKNGVVDKNILVSDSDSTNAKNKNIEFALLISNYIMLKKERWFIIPYEYCHKDYKEAIENKDISSLIRIFYDIELIKKEKRTCLEWY